jgi:DNA-binding MarR family transcriptional regulator
LEAAGLLTRDSGRASRRAVSLRLTAQGEALLDEARQRRREQIADVLDAMTPAERTELATGLAAFQQAAEPAGLSPDADDGQGPGIPFSMSA